MRELKSYRLLKQRFDHPAGTTVYEQRGWDYGLSSDDTRIIGQPHISVTLNSDGDYPGFTVPVADLSDE